MGNESLQGLSTYRWRYDNGQSRTDRWYWKEAGCLEVQVEQLHKNADGSFTRGASYQTLFDRIVQHADLELFFIPSDFVEESSMVAGRKYMERTRGKSYLSTCPACYQRSLGKPDEYEAKHAEALRRRGLATGDTKQ